MTIEGAIIAREAAHAGLHAQVNGRIYNLRALDTIEKDEFGAYRPFVVFTEIGEAREPQSGSDAHVRHAEFQFSSWGATYAAAAATDAQVCAAFDRFSGTLDSTVIECCFLGSKEPGYNDETREYRVDRTIMIHYEE